MGCARAPPAGGDTSGQPKKPACCPVQLICPVNLPLAVQGDQWVFVRKSVTEHGEMKEWEVF